MLSVEKNLTERDGSGQMTVSCQLTEKMMLPSAARSASTMSFTCCGFSTRFLFELIHD